MSFVLDQDAILVCSHGGQIRIGAGDSRLSSGDVTVVTSGMESGLHFPAGQLPPACGNMTTSSPSAPSPCITQAAGAGLAVKLSVGGRPVLLDTASGTTVPAATPAAPGTWKVLSPGQVKLRAS
jgi:hypothetical protein